MLVCSQSNKNIIKSTNRVQGNQYKNNRNLKTVDFRRYREKSVLFATIYVDRHRFLIVGTVGTYMLTTPRGVSGKTPEGATGPSFFLAKYKMGDFMKERDLGRDSGHGADSGNILLYIHSA